MRARRASLAASVFVVLLLGAAAALVISIGSGNDDAPQAETTPQAEIAPQVETTPQTEVTPQAETTPRIEEITLRPEEAALRDAAEVLRSLSAERFERGWYSNFPAYGPTEWYAPRSGISPSEAADRMLETSTSGADCDSLAAANATVQLAVGQTPQVLRNALTRVPRLDEHVIRWASAEEETAEAAVVLLQATCGDDSSSAAPQGSDHFPRLENDAARDALSRLRAGVNRIDALAAERVRRSWEQDIPIPPIGDIRDNHAAVVMLADAGADCPVLGGTMRAAETAARLADDYFTRLFVSAARGSRKDHTLDWSLAQLSIANALRDLWNATGCAR